MSDQSYLPATRTNLKLLLDDPKYKARISEVLRDRAPQFAAALVQLVARSSHLQKCTSDSLIGAAITAASMDLSLDPNLGEAHLVPYGDKCQFQIGYKGFTQLGLRSGQYKRLGWKVIYDGELVKWDELTGELQIDESKRKSETVIGYAAYFALTNGFERFSYWSKEKVEKHAGKYSQAFKAKKMDSTWFTNFDSMGLKTALKELISHWGPKSIQMQAALMRDQQVFVGVDDASYLDNPGSEDTKKPRIPRAAFESTPKTPAAHAETGPAVDVQSNVSEPEKKQATTSQDPF